MVSKEIMAERKSTTKRSERVEPDFIEIDELRLDKEWINQPRKYLDFCQQLAHVSRDLDEAKARLDVVKAEMDARIRKKPDRFGLDRATEASIAATILVTDEYQQALQEVIDAKYAKDMVGAAVGALDHRKKALEKLVELYLAGYFAEPKASRVTKEAMEEVGKCTTRRALKRS